MNCTSPTACLSCVVDVNRNDINPCSCKTGYFDNDSECEKCHYKC